MQGKTVVITGATSGIGEVAAEALAKMGARVVLVARDKARAEATLGRLPRSAPSADHRVHVADLLRLSEMKRVAAEIAAQTPRIDVLINNAGAIFGTRAVTEDGFERTFALNHLSYFVVTAGLRERLLATPGARIVSTASDAHSMGSLDFDDLQSAKGYGPLRVYGRSKLCNILFTRELARRLQGSGVTANCLHPGFVATRFADQSGGLLPFLIRIGKSLVAISPERGAQTMVYLASSPDVAGTTGQYFYRSRTTKPSAAARDDRAAALLWRRSAALAGIKDWG